jgi:hypothetical protein
VIVHPHRTAAAASLAAALTALAIVAAVFAPASRAAAAGSTSLCSVAKGVAGSIEHSASFSANQKMTPARLKTFYLTIQKSEPALLGAASGTMKTNLRKVFAFVNVVIADYKQVNWQTAGMLKFLPSLEPKAKAVQKPLNAVGTYFKKTCKFK